MWDKLLPMFEEKQSIVYPILEDMDYQVEALGGVVIELDGLILHPREKDLIRNKNALITLNKLLLKSMEELDDALYLFLKDQVEDLENKDVIIEEKCCEIDNLEQEGWVKDEIIENLKKSVTRLSEMLREKSSQSFGPAGQ